MPESDDDSSMLENFFEEHYLQESYGYFPRLDIYTRPSQYGSLAQAQALTSEDLDDELEHPSLWPTHEDAFTLFCDLTAILSFPGGMWIPCEPGEEVTPVLTAPLREDIRKQSLQFALYDAVGVVPCFWERGNGMSGSLMPANNAVLASQSSFGRSDR